MSSRSDSLSVYRSAGCHLRAILSESGAILKAFTIEHERTPDSHGAQHEP